MLLSTRRFRPSGPWCFAVSQPPARTSLWSCFEGMGAALWSWFLVGSEGNVKCPQARSVLQGHGVLLFRNRPLGLCCGAALRAWELHFGAAESNVRHQLRQHHQQQQQEQQQQAQQLQSLCFYQNPEGTSSPGIACFWKSFRPSGPWCFAVSQPPARTLLWSCFEGMGAALQKATLGTSSSSSTTSSRSSSSSRPSSCNRFVFTRIQKGRQAPGKHLFGGRSVLQGHGFAVSQPPPRTLLWSCFEGMGAALWSWFLVGSEGNVRHWSLLAGRRFRLSVPWCFAVSQPPARTLLWSCFEGMGAALWSWFLVGSESNIRHQLQQHHQQQQQEQQQQQAQQLQSLCFYQNPEGTSSPGTACFWRSFRPSGPWCFAVSQPPARTLLWSCFEGMGAALWSWFLVGSEGNVIGTSSSSSGSSSSRLSS